MAIIFQTGFDHYTTILQRFNSTSATGGGSIAIGAYGRNSTNGFRCACSAGGQQTLHAAKTIGNESTLYVAFGFKLSALPSAGNNREIIILQLWDTGSGQIFFSVLSNGLIRVARGGTVLGTSSNSVLSGVYYHFEAKIIIHNSTGEATVKINEVQWLTVTGADTQSTANAYANEVVLSGSSNGFNDMGVAINADFDDLVVATTGYNGDMQVRFFPPTGIGATNQWAANGAATTRECVDEAAPNDDTDYIDTATVTDLSLFTYGTIPTTSTILAVVPIPFAKKTDSGTAKIKSVVRHSGVNYAGAEKAPSNGSYEFHPDILEVNPGTAVAFTPTDWNAPIEIGPQRSA